MKSFLLTLFLFLCILQGTEAASSSPISYTGVSNMTINNLTIVGGAASCISLTNCSNITITNCNLSGTTGAGNYGVNLVNCTNITIQFCKVYNVTAGIYVSGSHGIVIDHDQLQNMTGAYPLADFIQFNNVSGGGNRITNNVMENVAGSSNGEVAIDIVNSNGLSSNPIIISGNQIRGPGGISSPTGGGILLGDGGGSYQVAQSNILVSPGSFGIGIAGGTGIKVISNSIYGYATMFNAAGIFYWNLAGTSSPSITVSNNRVNFVNSTYSYITK